MHQLLKYLWLRSHLQWPLLTRTIIPYTSILYTAALILPGLISWVIPILSLLVGFSNMPGPVGSRIDSVYSCCPRKQHNFSAYYSKHRVANHCYLFAGCKRNLKNCPCQGMAGKPRSMGSIWLTDGSVDKWLKTACPLLWLGFSNNVLHTLEKSYYTNDANNIRIPIIEKDVFSFKGFHWT